MAPPVVCAHGSRGCAWARPRQSGVLNKSLGFDLSPSKPPGFAKSGLAKRWRERGIGRISSAKPVPRCLWWGKQILGERAGGPNTAHPVTQTVSNPYLRLESADGKHVAETPHKPQARREALSSD
jgi:hypothetical protein